VNTGNGRVQAIAKTSSEGTADAQVKIHAGAEGPDAITITRDGSDPIRIQANTSGASIGPLDFTDAEIEDEQTNGGAHVFVQIADAWLGGCDDCPTPPDLPPPVEPPDLAPIALADDYTFGNGDVLIILDTEGVLINDYDPDGEPGDILIAIIFGGTTTTQGGDVALEENGGFTYTAPDDKVFDDGFGTDLEGDYALFIDSFDYYVEDPDGLPSNEVTVTVTSKNYIPVANPDFYDISHNVTLDVTDSASGTIEGLLPEYADLDADPGDTLSAVLHGDGASVLGGSVVLNADGTFTYTPPGGVVGTDRFMYYATDGYNDSEIVDVTIELINALPVSPAAPGLMPIEVGTSGCPALVKWTAAELGADQETIQIWFANSLASGRSIQPCDACTGLKAAATVLQDDDGTHLAALAAVISEFASSDAPPSEEQMASIADAIANDVEGNMQYAAAGEYLDALAAYVGVLTGEMGLSATDAIQLATDNYVGQLADDADAGVAAYVATRLAELGG
jgi:hypothetical protein